MHLISENDAARLVDDGPAGCEVTPGFKGRVPRNSSILVNGTYDDLIVFLLTERAAAISHEKPHAIRAEGADWTVVARHHGAEVDVISAYYATLFRLWLCLYGTGDEDRF